MSIVKNQQSLSNFISNELNDNVYDVEFRSDLFYSDDIQYYYTDETGAKNRFVPTIIPEIPGEYLNIPNSNSTTNNLGIQFDIFVGIQDESDLSQDEFEKVNYINTLNAIEEFKGKLLAKYFPLGVAGLYFGGEDSNASFNITTPFNAEYINISFENKNLDDEGILTLYGNGNIIGENHLFKFNGDFVFLIDNIRTMSIPATIGEVTLTITNVGGTWSITDGTNTDTDVYAFDLIVDSFKFGEDANLGVGLEAIIKEVTISTTIDIETPEIYLYDFDSKSTFTNSGSSIIDTTNVINNCIIWSDDGNAIFGFGTLNPISDIRAIDGGALYQTYELELNVFISNDVLFGNNFEYYLDGIQVFPIDRQHTLATQQDDAQFLLSNEVTSIAEESVRDHTMSFYYIPTKQLTSILKHIVSGDIAQNTTYTLLVQYPFFQVSYDVLLENGGTAPNINTLSTFTITFKKADSSL